MQFSGAFSCKINKPIFVGLLGILTLACGAVIETDFNVFTMTWFWVLFGFGVILMFEDLRIVSLEDDDETSIRLKCKLSVEDEDDVRQSAYQRTVNGDPNASPFSRTVQPTCGHCRGCGTVGGLPCCVCRKEEFDIEHSKSLIQ